MFARLVQREDYLVQVTLPPSVLISAPPATATIQLENGQQKEIHFISPATKTNVSIQGASLLYTVAASSDLLPGMNVLALAFLWNLTIEGVVVPEPAIVWWQGHAWAHVRNPTPRTPARRGIATDYPLPHGEYLVRTLQGGGPKLLFMALRFFLSEEFRLQIQVGEEGEQK